MCALNIRWGHKGSIQEFSTLLRAPAPRPPSLLQPRWEPGLCETDTLCATTTTMQSARGLWAGDKTVNDSCPVCNLWASATAANVVSTLLLLQLLSLRIPSKETKAKLKGTAFPVPPNVYAWPFAFFISANNAPHPLLHLPPSLKFLSFPGAFWYSPSFSFYATGHVTWLCVAKVTDGFHLHQMFRP